MRWENTACDTAHRRYFLIDLELCDHADKAPTFKLTIWDTDTLVNGRYAQASDLHSLGRMLQDLLDPVIVSDEGRSVVAAVMRPASQQQSTAS